ncbi:putative deoxyribose-specific ABC transporter, permease protein [Streptococcus sp. DD11]|uniref:ABC transporter permease n=1 Tax=Streptococcus sp. DD11 TaxID=1777879 RepID=UPI00079506E1|nr:ABC transporter permease [Streptococcus sp. DD11]KXT80408.1 putative deoxyribose-specific ABC transporter, permease protein [Streptococcus sp. DD11]
MSKKTQKIAVPLISVLLGILLGALVMWAFGYDAIWGYESLFKTAFGSLRSFGEISRAMGPLILIALGFAVASRAGFFNVGLPGQALAGWILAGWFALSFPELPRPLMILATIVIAAAAGGLIGAIPGILRAYLGTSEVIVTIMMNYIVLFVGNAIIHDAFPKSVMQSVDSSKRVGANAIYQTDWLRSLTSNSRMNIGIFFALIAVVIIWYLLKKTTLGFEIRSVGLNPHASEYAGMSAKRTIILSMIISGALAGLGGVVEGLGTYQNVFVQGGSLSVGFNGMAVSLLAANSPIGILFAAFLFAVLSVGAPGMNVAQIPTELVNIVTASIIFFVSAHYIIERLTGKTVFEWFQNSRKTNKTVKGEN